MEILTLSFKGLAMAYLPCQPAIQPAQVEEIGGVWQTSQKLVQGSRMELGGMCRLFADALQSFSEVFVSLRQPKILNGEMFMQFFKEEVERLAVLFWFTVFL